MKAILTILKTRPARLAPALSLAVLIVLAASATSLLWPDRAQAQERRSGVYAVLGFAAVLVLGALIIVGMLGGGNPVPIAQAAPPAASPLSPNPTSDPPAARLAVFSVTYFHSDRTQEDHIYKMSPLFSEASSQNHYRINVPDYATATKVLVKPYQDGDWTFTATVTVSRDGTEIAAASSPAHTYNIEDLVRGDNYIDITVTADTVTRKYTLNIVRLDCEAVLGMVTTDYLHYACAEPALDKKSSDQGGLASYGYGQDGDYVFGAFSPPIISDLHDHKIYRLKEVIATSADTVFQFEMDDPNESHPCPGVTAKANGCPKDGVGGWIIRAHGQTLSMDNNTKETEGDMGFVTFRPDIVLPWDEARAGYEYPFFIYHDRGPTLDRGKFPTVDHDQIYLVYNLPLSESNTPPLSAFTVTVNDESAALTGIRIDERLVTLTLAEEVGNGDRVVLNYNSLDLTSDQRLQNASGGQAYRILNQVLDNRTVQGCYDDVPEDAFYKTCIEFLALNLVGVVNPTVEDLTYTTGHVGEAWRALSSPLFLRGGHMYELDHAEALPGVNDFPGMKVAVVVGSAAESPDNWVLHFSGITEDLARDAEYETGPPGHWVIRVRKSLDLNNPRLEPVIYRSLSFSPKPPAGLKFHDKYGREGSLEEAIRSNEGFIGGYYVSLTTEPTETVYITPTVPAGSESALTLLKCTRATARPEAADWGKVVFEPDNYNTPQPVCYESLDDPDSGDHLISLIHNITSTDGDYSGLANEVEVRVVDDESPERHIRVARQGNWLLSDAATGRLFFRHDEEVEAGDMNYGVEVLDARGNRAPFDEDVDINVQFSPVSFDKAYNGEDYTARNGIYTIPAGQSYMPIPAELHAEDVVEKNEHFSLRIDWPNGTPPVIEGTTVTINNVAHRSRIISRETVGFRFVEPIYHATEGDTVQLGIMLDSTIGFGLGMNLATLYGSEEVDGVHVPEMTFTEGTEDYSKMIHFPANTQAGTIRNIPLHIIADDRVEPTEDFRIVLERLPGVNQYAFYYGELVGDCIRYLTDEDTGEYILDDDGNKIFDFGPGTCVVIRVQDVDPQPESNNPPELIEIPEQQGPLLPGLNVGSGAPFTYNVSRYYPETDHDNDPSTEPVATPFFTDPDGHEIVYRASLIDDSPLPSWMSFNPDTVTFSGTAPVSAEGNSYTIKFIADDQQPVSNTAYITWQFSVIDDPISGETLITFENYAVDIDSSLVLGCVKLRRPDHPDFTRYRVTFWRPAVGETYDDPYGTYYVFDSGDQTLQTDCRVAFGNREWRFRVHMLGKNRGVGEEKRIDGRDHDFTMVKIPHDTLRVRIDPNGLYHYVQAGRDHIAPKYKIRWRMDGKTPNCPYDNSHGWCDRDGAFHRPYEQWSDEVEVRNRWYSNPWLGMLRHHVPRGKAATFEFQVAKDRDGDINTRGWGPWSESTYIVINRDLGDIEAGARTLQNEITTDPYNTSGQMSTAVEWNDSEGGCGGPSYEPYYYNIEVASSRTSVGNVLFLENSRVEGMTAKPQGRWVILNEGGDKYARIYCEVNGTWGYQPDAGDRMIGNIMDLNFHTSPINKEFPVIDIHPQVASHRPELVVNTAEGVSTASIFLKLSDDVFDWADGYGIINGLDTTNRPSTGDFKIVYTGPDIPVSCHCDHYKDIKVTRVDFITADGAVGDNGVKLTLNRLPAYLQHMDLIYTPGTHPIKSTDGRRLPGFREAVGWPTAIVDIRFDAEEVNIPEDATDGVRANIVSDFSGDFEHVGTDLPFRVSIDPNYPESHAGLDFTEVDGVIPAYETETYVVIQSLDNDVVNQLKTPNQVVLTHQFDERGREIFPVQMRGNGLRPDGTVTINIFDRRDTTDLYFPDANSGDSGEILTADVREGEEIEIRAALTRAAVFDITVRLDQVGLGSTRSATHGDDWVWKDSTSSTGLITFPAGETTATITFQAKADEVNEDDHQHEVVIIPPTIAGADTDSRLTVKFGASLTISIVDTDLDLPYAPLGVSASGDADSITVSWNAATGAASYKVYRRTGSDDFASVATGITGTSYDDTNVVTGTTYDYYVVSSNAAGDSSPSASVSASLSAQSPSQTVNLDAPTNLTATGDADSIALDWDAVTGATGYKVLRRVGADAFAEIATTVSASYDDTSVVADTTYDYIVRATDGDNEGLDSAIASASLQTTAPEEPTEPAPVTDLAATISEDGESVVLTWTGSADDVDRYAVDRETLDSDPEENITVGVVDADTITITDDDITAGRTYRYSVIAIAVGEDVTLSEAVTVDVEVPAADTSGPLTRFALVDTSAPSTHTILSDGDVVELDDPDNGSYGIYITTLEDVGSVGLLLVGPKTVSRTENIAPYSLYGDNGENDINGEALPAGSYLLTAVAYSGSNLSGEEVGRLKIAFTVESE